MIIYCIKNKINGKCYIGLSSKYNSNEELQKSRMWGHGTYIKRAIKKHGLENFERWILIKNIFNFDELDRYEILWIVKLKTKAPHGYNLADGGGGPKGYKLTEKQKNKPRKKKSVESIERSAAGHRGKKQSISCIKKRKYTFQNTIKNRTEKRKREIKRNYSESNKKRIYKKVCKQCNTEFWCKGPDTKLCNSCKKILKLKKLIKICKQCNNEFQIKIKNTIYCDKCKEKNIIKKYFRLNSKEHKKEISLHYSESNKKKIFSKICKQCNSKFQCKGPATLLCNLCTETNKKNKKRRYENPIEIEKTRKAIKKSWENPERLIKQKEGFARRREELHEQFCV